MKGKRNVLRQVLYMEQNSLKMEVNKVCFVINKSKSSLFEQLGHKTTTSTPKFLTASLSFKNVHFPVKFAPSFLIKYFRPGSESMRKLSDPSVIYAMLVEEN